MHSTAMGADSRLALVRSQTRTHQSRSKFVQLSQLRRMRGCEKVAAVCFRVRSAGIEFLLVRTGSGHWTFPKGNAEPGLTHAQAAALEAYEEAGVHGRMEEVSFARYVRRKRGGSQNSIEIAVSAHLCEVSRLDPPQEFDRDPTWFAPEKAKRRLREDRTSDYAAELARVIDRAVNRIQRLRRGSGTGSDRLPEDVPQAVHFTIAGIRRTTSRATALGSRGNNSSML
jgi:8-oxo-dGTP pyrophosphatase MutT (NUDIX family)